MAGTGWNCPAGGSVCTRGDVLLPGASYPPITVTVNVASNASYMVTNAVTVTGGGSGPASATDIATVIGGVTSQGLALYPVTPCRVADTRNPSGPFGGPIMSSGSTRSFVVPQSACNIPAGAQAYSLNITVVPPAPLGYLTAWPTGQAQPYVSTLNSYNGATIANAAIVPAGTGGAISIYVSDATQVIIDINGYFAAPGGAGALAFYPATPCRVADTRNPNGPFGGPSLAAGATRNFTVPQSACNVPSSAQAYSLNMTVVPPGPLEYLSTWPTGQTQPYVSTLNALQGQIAANAAIVPAGANGDISVCVSDPSNVIVDIERVFCASGQSGSDVLLPGDALPRGGHAQPQRHVRRPVAGRQLDAHLPDSFERVRSALDGAGVLIQHDGGSSGIAAVPEHMAGGANPAGSFDPERLAGAGSGERGDCSGGDGGRDQCLRERPDQPDHRRERLLRAVAERAPAAGGPAGPAARAAGGAARWR